mgnify:FL=1
MNYEMKPISSEYYGDNTRWFVATVIDSTPPYGLEGRVKIRVHGIHTESTKDIPQNDLPWAQCMLPTTEGGISGIGRSPNIQANALVFGIFADGVNSQVPIVLGSLPHIETPTEVQISQTQFDIRKSNDADQTTNLGFDVISEGDRPIENELTTIPSKTTQNNREKMAVKFFLNLGYTIKQSVSIVAGLSNASLMTTGATGKDGKGIGNFNTDRYRKLQNFSNDYALFTTQLRFVAYELNNEKTQANILLLQSDKVEGPKGTAEIFARYYLNDVSQSSGIQAKAKDFLDRIV